MLRAPRLLRPVVALGLLVAACEPATTGPTSIPEVADDATPPSDPLPARPAAAPADATAERPSVLLVIVDTLRADRLSTYGFADGKTPTLDRLGRASVVFDRAIAASAATVPSHASLFTSRYVRQHSVGYRNGGTRLDDEATLAEQFRAAGYATAAFVSNVMLNHSTGLDRGFDVYDEDLPEHEPNRPLYVERSAPLTTKKAIRWLEHTGDRPVLLVVHYQDPHGPYTPPEHLLREIPPLQRQDDPRLPVNATQSGQGGLPAYQALPGLDRPSQYESRYVAEILYMDRWLGLLLAAFDEHRPDAGHIVLFTADHGESLGEEQHWFEHGHTSTPDLAHVPFLLRAPGIEAGRRRDPVSHVDVLPTLLEMAGLPVPRGAAGIALGPYLRSGRELPPRRLYCDLGIETGVYDDTGLTRVRFPSLEAAERGDASEAIVGRYQWSGTGAWTPQGSPSPLETETKAYLDHVKPTKAVPRTLDEDDVQRLRALGYLEPKPTD